VVLAGFGRLATGSQATGIRLYVGNYGLQSLSVFAALEAIRKIGYDGAELCAMQGWPSEPQLLSREDRRRIRDSGFPIPTIIDSWSLMTDDAGQRATREKIRVVAELAHDVGKGNPAMLQTVLGGRPPDWPDARERMAGHLMEWARVAEAAKVKLAVKAHASQAVDTPDKLLWLLDRVGNQALTAIYDYGHFQLRDLSIEETMDALLPRSAFLTVKDSKIVDGKPRFLLPGDGTIDYTRYFSKVQAMKWSGWVLVEITRQLQTEPGYDGARAAERSYAHLAPVLKRLGLR
jgi:inosose dehydratase